MIFKRLNLLGPIYKHNTSRLLSNTTDMAVGPPLRSEPQLAQPILCTLPGSLQLALRERVATLLPPA